MFELVTFSSMAVTESIIVFKLLTNLKLNSIFPLSRVHIEPNWLFRAFVVSVWTVEPICQANFTKASIGARHIRHTTREVETKTNIFD